jgi:hypothetical protein
MASSLASLDNAIANNNTLGQLAICHADRMATATTAATTSSGYISAQRYPLTVAIASGGSASGGYMTMCSMLQEDATVGLLCGLEYLLGTLTISGNSFSDGVAMPTKTVRGTSAQSATLMPMLYVSTTLVAVTPVITITYVNQSGLGGQTATLTLPTNAAVGSAFCIAPHLASGDTGIQNITGISTSAGTGGVLKIYGVLPLAEINQGGSSFSQVSIPPLALPNEMFLITNAETLGFYRFGAVTTNTLIVAMSITPEST